MIILFLTFVLVFLAVFAVCLNSGAGRFEMCERKAQELRQPEAVQTDSHFPEVRNQDTATD